MIVDILPRTDFDFSGLAGSGSTGAIPLVQDLDVAVFGRATMLLRVHTATMGEGASFRFDARTVAPTSQDPATFFRGPLVSTVVVTAESVSAPTLLRCPVSDLGYALSFFVTATMGADPATLRFAISAVLVLEESVDDWHPLALSSKLRLWLDDHDLVVVNGLYSNWGDQSPAQNDFKQETASLRPSLGDRINDQSAPGFDGLGDHLESGSLSSFVQASSYHAFAVIRADTVSANSITSYFNNPVIADGGAGWWGVFLRNASGVLETLAFHWDIGESVAVASGFQVNVDTLIEWSFDGATIRCQVGGNPVASVAASSIASVVEPVRIGTGASGAPFLDGVVASAIVCNQYLSATERLNVRGYLAARYGLAT